MAQSTVLRILNEDFTGSISNLISAFNSFEKLFTCFMKPSTKIFQRFKMDSHLEQVGKPFELPEKKNSS